MENLHHSWCEFENELRESGIQEERCDAILGKLYRYVEESVTYRLSDLERVEELKLQLRNCYYKTLHPSWVAELNGHEVIELLPALVPASLHWDPAANPPLVHLVNVCLDALPRELAGTIYLEAFTRYLQGFGYYGRATPGERVRILTDYMWLDRQYIYRSATAQDHRLELGNIIRDLLGEEAATVYQAGLDAARVRNTAEATSV